MLTVEDNEILTHVGPGTLMGNLLRRYWMPGLLSAELPVNDGPPLRVRLLCEDLIAFRDTNGDVGLVANACPHRGASLFFGRNEEAGLRCVYHGWKFDTTGACVDMPSEPAESNFKTKVRVQAYPAYESGGIVWTYMGPKELQPGFPDFGTESMPQGEWSARKVLTQCNWIQGLEGNLDSAHIAFLHGGRSPLAPPRQDPPDAADFDKPGYPPMRSRYRRQENPWLEVQDTWYGFRYAGLRKTPAGYTNARVTDFIMPFYTYVPNPYGPLGGNGAGMYVPIDDDHTWRMNFVTKGSGDVSRVMVEPTPVNARTTVDPYVNGVRRRSRLPENDYLIDRESQRVASYTGIDSDNADQDMAVTESMGAIYDRSHEHLGTTDRAIIRMRRMLIDTAKDLAKGIEPRGLDASRPFDRIRSAERVLDAGEDWRMLGTDTDVALTMPVAPLIS